MELWGQTHMLYGWRPANFHVALQFIVADVLISSMPASNTHYWGANLGFII
jgi:hypothetical protein